jgi:hypothetical protein
LAPATLNDLSLSQLATLTSKFQNNDPENFIPKAKERLAELVDEQNKQRAIDRAESERRSAMAEEVRIENLENKHIGDQVCQSSDGSIQQSTGYQIYGQTQYRTIQGRNRVVGFVEKIEGRKIQIRISGINFTAPGINQPLETLSNFNGGSTLKINSIIWDSLYEWEGC